MTLQELKNKKSELLNEARNLRDTDLKAAQEKLAEAKELQNKIVEMETFENQLSEEAKNLANERAFTENNTVTNISNKSVNIGEGEVMDKLNNEVEVKDEAKLYNTAFAKSMMGVELNKEESETFNKVNADFRNATQTAEQHTVLVPETVRQGIWAEIGETHPIFGDITPTFIPGKVTIIKEENEMSDAEWVDEDTEGNDDEVGFGTIDLDGCELVKSIKISWKLKKMSIDAFLSYITTKLAEKMGNAIAKAMIDGKGKPGSSEDWKAQPKGIATELVAEASTPQVITYTGKITYDNMLSLMSKIKSGYINGSSFYANNSTIWNELATIKDGDGKSIFIPDATLGGVGRIFGVTVKEEDGCANGQVLLGNVQKGYVMNINENMTIYTEDHVKARTTDYMGYALIDGDVVTTKAFALLKK